MVDPVVVVDGCLHRPARRAGRKKHGGVTFARFTDGYLPLRWPAACPGHVGVVYVNGRVFQGMPVCEECGQ